MISWSPSPFALYAAVPVDVGEGVPRLLLVLAATIVGAKLGAAAARAFRQPAVLGELFAGILLGPSLLGIVDPTQETFFVMGELGLLILLFQIGLHTELASILRVGGPAAAVGMTGVLLPFLLGLALLGAVGVPTLAATVASAALTATSLGISARILADLGVLDRPEGQIVIGAAVIDDIIGLIILTVVSDLALGGNLAAGEVVRIAAVAIGFLVLALGVGSRVIPPLARAAGSLREGGALGSMALAFALTLAAVAARSGSAMIIGAFAAGLVLHATPERKDIEKATTTLGYLFVPIFFVGVGASVNVHAFTDPSVLAVGGLLMGVGIVGKVLAGFAPFWIQANKPLIGIAMVPRGEVGLIFAQMGLSSGALSENLFSAVLLMVIVTTLITPPALAWCTARERRRPTPHGWGLGELVTGPESPTDQDSGTDPENGGS